MRWTRLYIPAQSAVESAAHPDKTNGFMLRGIHKASSNWIGRVVMGVVLGLIAISFGIWGIGDIFRGFGQSTVAKVGGTEIRVDTVPPALPGPAAAARPPVGPADPAGPGQGARPRPAVARRGDRRDRARRAGARAAAQRQRRRDRARRSPTIPDFKGITGQFDRAAVRADRCATWATPRRASWPSSAADRCASSWSAPSAAKRSCRRPRSRRSTASRTKSAPSNMSRSAAAQAGDIAGADARGARQVFRGAQGRVPRAGIPQDHAGGADAGRARVAGSRCRTPT